MTDIHKISEITGLSLRTLRLVEKHGFLKVSKSSDPIQDSARMNLKRGNRLTAIQQLHLLRTPAAREGLEKWRDEIDATLKELGDVEADAAPWSIAMKIPLAARKDKSSIETVAAWLRGFMIASDDFDDGKPHAHAFLAVRLLANVPPHQIELIAGQINACLWNCRSSELLQGFWRVDDGRTIYQRPAKKSFDL